jgi:hypothetical protein
LETQFFAELSSLVVSTDGQPALLGPHRKWIELNTFTDEVSSDSIRLSYYRACRRLDALRGGLARRTYSWEDEITYPGVSSVVQYPSCYIETGVFSGNDSDTVWVRVVQGVFPTGNRIRNLRELPSDDLPPGTLRCQWN